MKKTLLWRPQPGPQEAFVACPLLDVCYGGARGGGKTDACLGDFAIHAGRVGAAALGVFFRREGRALEEAIARSHEIYSGLGAKYNSGRAEWRFPGGARLKFRDLENAEAARKYQGHAYTRLYFEELTQWPDPAPIDMLTAALRSAAGAPVGMRSTCNPGGPGHGWVKARYVDPAPMGYRPIPLGGGMQRVFIPARLADNRALNLADPLYGERLKLAGSKALVRAWLEGDWDQPDGAFFDCWDARKHVVAPRVLPADWARFRSFDWGSARPFSVGWWAVSDGALAEFPRGALVRYREWYGALAANRGLKLTAEEVAQGIAGRERGETVTVGVADPAIFTADGGPSLAERMRRSAGVGFHPADNKRLPGWDALRKRLVGMDGRPMLYVFSTCVDSIRTVPNLPHDPLRPEDLDSDSEDHAADEWRYAAMHRVWTPPGLTAPGKKPGRWDRAFAEKERVEDGFLA